MKDALKERIANFRELFKLFFALFFGDLVGTLGVVKKDGFGLWAILGVISSLWLLLFLVGIWLKLSAYVTLLEEISDED